MNILNLFVDTQRIKNMTRGYWLINFNRSEVRRFTKERANEDQFNKYVFIYNGKIIGVLSKETPLKKSREEFKIEEAREILKRLIEQEFRITNLFD